MTTDPFSSCNLNVAVVLVNWNNWRDAVECVDSLLGQRHANLHIFIVDNLSADNSLEHIQDWCREPRALTGWRDLPGVRRYTQSTAEGPLPIAVRILDAPSASMPTPASAPEPGTRLTLVRSGANRGFAGGCNVGIRTAGLEQFDYFWLLNTDTVVDSDALDALLRRAASDPVYGLVGSTLRYYEQPERVQAFGGAEADGRVVTTRHIGQNARIHDSRSAESVEAKLVYVCGASMLVSRKFIREVGLMQEDYFLFYEEYDWAVRGKGRFRLGYAPDSHIFHKVGASSGKIMPLFTSRFFFRSRVRFTSRFYPEQLGFIKRALAMELLRHAARGRLRLAWAVAETLWSADRVSREVTTNV